MTVFQEQVWSHKIFPHKLKTRGDVYYGSQVILS